MSNKPKISKEYIEDSWNEMTLVLDREMPIKKKRQQLFIMLLFALIFGLLAFLFSTYYNTKSKTNDIANYNSSVPNVNSNTKKETNDTPPIFNIAKENTSTFKKSDNDKSSFKNKPSHLTKDNRNKNHNKNLNSTKESTVFSKIQILKKSQEKFIPKFYSKSQIRSQNKFPLEESFLDIKKRNLIILNTLPRLKYSLSQLGSRNAILFSIQNMGIPIDIKNTPRSKKWSLDLEAHGITIPKENYNGLGLALGINRYINSSMGISLSAGLSRWSRQVEFSDLKFEDDFETAITEGNELDFNNSTFELLSRSWNFEVSLGLYYNIHSKILLKGGSRYRKQFSRSYNTVFNTQNTMLGIPNERVYLDGSKNFVLPYIGIDYIIAQQFRVGFELEKSFSNSNQNVIKNNSQLYMLKLSYTL